MLFRSALFALVAFAGLVLTIASKREKIKQLGYILEGVGLIFIGLNVMSGAVNDLVESENIGSAIENMFISLGNGKSFLTWEIIVLFLLGALLTALMQSSGALTAIVISLASSSLISLQMANHMPLYIFWHLRIFFCDLLYFIFPKTARSMRISFV